MSIEKDNQQGEQLSTSLPLLLIVDDEKDILEVCKMSLSGSFEVTTFSDPAEALDYFRTHSSQFDLVLTDIRMPKLNGFQLARQIGSLNSNIPILFMTAFNIYPTEYQTDFPAADKDEFVQKPDGLLEVKARLFERMSNAKAKHKA